MSFNNIILLGYKGAGKSTLGQRLAQDWGLAFLDLDRWFEQTHDCELTRYVNEHGIQNFRDAEAALIQSLDPACMQVIATGGGVVDRSENINHLKQLGCLVFLDLPYGLILQRLQRLGRVPDFISEPHFNLRRQRYLEASDLCFQVSTQAMDVLRDEFCQFLRENIHGVK